MNFSHEPAFLILALEAIVLLLVALGAGLYWFVRQKSLDRNALQDLVAKIKSGDTPHRQSLQNMLNNIYHYEGEELRGAVDELVTRERDVYRALVGIYQNRDRSRLISFKESVEALVALSVGLVPKTNDEAFERAIEILTAERDRIDKELEETKQSFANLMDEYSAAFNKERSRATETKVALQASSTQTGAIETDADLAVELPTSAELAMPAGSSPLMDTLNALDAALGTQDQTPAAENQPEPGTMEVPLSELQEVDIVEASADPADIARIIESSATGT